MHNWSRLLVASAYSRTGRRTRGVCDGGYEEVVEEKHDLAPDAECDPTVRRVERSESGGVVFQETRERVYRFGSELLG